MHFSEAKIANTFKIFIEKVFVPQLNKMDPSCRQQWNRLSEMMEADHPNLGEIQLYIQTLPSPSCIHLSPEPRDKGLLGKKLKKEIPSDQNNKSLSFNPIKTFGGERNKGPMFPLSINCEEKKESETSKEGLKTQPITHQAILPLLDKLYKVFMENQQKLEKIVTSQG